MLVQQVTMHPMACFHSITHTNKSQQNNKMIFIALSPNITHMPLAALQSMELIMEKHDYMYNVIPQDPQPSTNINILTCSSDAGHKAGYCGA